MRELEGVDGVEGEVKEVELGIVGEMEGGEIW